MRTFKRATALTVIAAIAVMALATHARASDLKTVLLHMIDVADITDKTSALWRGCPDDVRQTVASEVTADTMMVNMMLNMSVEYKDKKDFAAAEVMIKLALKFANNRHRLLKEACG